MILGKDYMGSDDLLDFTESLLNEDLPERKNIFDFDTEINMNAEIETERISRDDFIKANENNNIQVLKEIKTIKCLSATNLGKLKDKSFDEVIEIMTIKNYIFDKQTISPEGEKIGITYKSNAQGKKWIVYPESLAELL